MFSKYHKIISGVIAVVFVVVVQSFSTPFPIFRFLVPAFVVCTAAVQVYNYYYLKELQKKPFWTLVRLTLFFIAWFGLYSLVHVVLLRGIFLVFSVAVIYIFERILGNFGEHIVLGEVLLIAWAMLLVIFGLTDYLHLVAPYLVAIGFFAILLLVRSSLSFVPYGEMVKWVAALAIALFVTELEWAVSFLPFHYSALAMILFSMFYVLYSLYYYALFNTLTWKRAQFHIGLAAVLVFFTIISTPWKVIN